MMTKPLHLAALLLLAAPPALAQQPEADPGSIWSRANLLGDLGGLRPALVDKGITLTLIEQSEVLGNTTGGLKQGATYDGLTTLTAQLDTKTAFGWEGGTFNLSALQIHGRNLSQYYLANLQTASGIEAAPTTRLWELWYQQSFGGGAFDIKLGQQSLDQEFLTSSGSALFLNTMMGWPALPSIDMYAGGPAYPLSSLGLRLRGTPMDNVTLLGGVFQDNPPGGPFADDSQLRGTTRWGGNFSLRTGALFIAEAQYAINQPPTDTTAPKPTGLPASYKIGFWYDTASFPDQRTGTRLLRGNTSLYAVVDQGIWQAGGDSAQALSVFGRLMAGPSDRNQVDLSFNGGFTLKAPLPGRDNDTLGIGYGVARISSNAAALDQDRARLSPTPIRSAEHFIEVTYQAQITPWLQIQPDAQYIFAPGGGIANPYAPTKRLANEAVFGVRTNITF